MWITLTKDGMPEIQTLDEAKQLLETDDLFEYVFLHIKSRAAAVLGTESSSRLLKLAQGHQVQIELTAEDILLDRLQVLQKIPETSPDQIPPTFRSSQNASTIEHQGAKGCFPFSPCFGTEEYIHTILPPGLVFRSTSTFGEVKPSGGSAILPSSNSAKTVRDSCGTHLLGFQSATVGLFML